MRRPDTATAVRRPAGGMLAVLAAAVLIAVLVSRASSGDPITRPGTATARLGSLTVLDAYAPQQTSATLASVYLRVRNAGARDDRLVTVTTDRAGRVDVMREHSGDGVAGMTEQPDLPVPAHQTVTLSPGVGHLMLVDPTSPLRQGRRVALLLRFARAGTLTLTVPVTAVGGP